MSRRVWPAVARLRTIAATGPVIPSDGALPLPELADLVPRAAQEADQILRLELTVARGDVVDERDVHGEPRAEGGGRRVEGGGPVGAFVAGSRNHTSQITC